MEKINLHNYEAYFLDAIEGNLDDIQQEELQNFLMKYPELKSELEEFENLTLPHEEANEQVVHFHLMKDEKTKLNLIDYLMISKVEGIITSPELEQLSTIIGQEEKFIKELATYHKTKLPLEKIVFEPKSTLLKKERKIMAWWPYVAAASILLLLFFNLNKKESFYFPKDITWNANSKENDTQNYTGIVLRENQLQKKNLSESNPLLPQSTLTTNQVTEKRTPSDDKNNVKLTKIDEGNNDLEEMEGEVNSNQSMAVREEKENTRMVESPEVELLASKKAQTAAKIKDQFIPAKEFAKQKIKNEVFKGKTFTETILEEIATVSNNKLKIESTKSKEDLSEGFAINIGKFSFSKNK